MQNQARIDRRIHLIYIYSGVSSEETFHLIW